MEHFTIAMLGIANLPIATLVVFLKLKTLSAVK